MISGSTVLTLRRPTDPSREPRCSPFNPDLDHHPADGDNHVPSPRLRAVVELTALYILAAVALIVGACAVQATVLR